MKSIIIAFFFKLHEVEGERLCPSRFSISIHCGKNQARARLVEQLQQAHDSRRLPKASKEVIGRADKPHQIV